MGPGQYGGRITARRFSYYTIVRLPRFQCSLPYASSETGSHHSFLAFSPGTSTAMCENQLSFFAPCQCLTPAGMSNTYFLSLLCAKAIIPPPHRYGDPSRAVASRPACRRRTAASRAGCPREQWPPGRSASAGSGLPSGVPPVPTACRAGCPRGQWPPGV